METVNIAAKLALFDETWSPKIVGQVNGMHVKVAKLQGEFLWHSHENEDEMFLVVSGELTMHYRDCEAVAGPGEFIIVPRGVEHKPSCAAETHVMLFEPAETVNTGDAEDSDRTRTPEWI